MNDPANSSDEELADSLSNSDAQAVAVLADRYTRPLYDFALRLTLDPEASGDIVIGAFETLMESTAQRPAATRVRAVLFNRALVLGLEQADNRGRPTNRKLLTSDRRFTEADASVDREAALWAWQSARSLRPRDYALLDLTARRGLKTEEFTGPVTQARGGVETILTRATAAFVEAYVATALYFRGREACADLSELVGGSGAAMRVGIRRQIISHAEDCVACQRTLETLPGASEVFAALHDVDIPDELPSQVVAMAAGSATAAADQLTLESEAGPADEDLAPAEGPPQSADPPFAAGLPYQEGETTEPPGPEDGQPEDWQPVSEDDVPGPPASEEELWTRPQIEAGIAGMASADLPQALSDIEERLGTPPFEPPPFTTEVYEEYGSEYAVEEFAYSGYEPPSLTLKDRLSIWFEPAYGRSFVVSYAVLGAVTAAAILVGILLAGALSGGGSSDQTVTGPEVVRVIACETGRLSVDSGRVEIFEFDPSALSGFELESVVVADAPDVADSDALTVDVSGATALRAAAASVVSPTARSVEYGLQLLWRRGTEDAVTDCPLVVNVPASTAPAQASPTSETPAPETPAPETPEATP